MKSLFQENDTLILFLYSCSTFSIRTPSIRVLSSSFLRYFARLDQTNCKGVVVIFLVHHDHLFTYLLFSFGSKHGSNGGSSYIHLEHSYFFFRARSRLLLRQIKSNIQNICILQKIHLLVIWAIIAAIINSKWERQTRMLSSHRSDNDWVGIIQKSPILYRSFKLRMFFLLGKLRVTGSRSAKRWEPESHPDGRGKTATFLIRRHQSSCPLSDLSRSLFHVNIQQTITRKKTFIELKYIYFFGVKNEGWLWGEDSKV